MTTVPRLDIPRRARLLPLLLSTLAQLAAAGWICEASAQTMGLATMQPGTLSHTTASAIAKVLKDKASLNVLVQPTAGEAVAIAIVNKGEAELGLANTPELSAAIHAGASPHLRLIGPVHPLRVAFFVRQSSGLHTIADLKGKRVTMGYSAMRALDGVARAILATGGLTEKDVQPVLVPNVIRSADEFLSGASDMFYFAFGAPKVREADATAGGIRALRIPDVPGIAAAKAILPYGYLTEIKPGPAFVGITQPTLAYTFDNLLFTHAGVPDEVVGKIIATMRESVDDLAAIQPALREFSASSLNRNFAIPYHPGALTYFKQNKIEVRSF